MENITDRFRALILAVVSTPGQAGEDKTSLKDQTEAAEDYAESIDAQIIETLAFVHSRKYRTLDALCLDSPEYARFIELVRTQAVNLVIIWRKNRLGRTTRLQLEAIEYCADWGVQIHGLKDALHPPISPSQFWLQPRSAGETFMTTVHAGWSQADNEQRVEDLMRGKEGRARDRGLHLCVNTPPYGYMLDGPDNSKPLIPRPGEWLVVRRIFDERLAGRGLASICKGLNRDGLRRRRGGLWQSAPLSEIVHNPYYAGIVVFHRWRKLPNGKRMMTYEKEYPGIHQPLLTSDEWEAVKRLNRSRARDYVYMRKPTRLLAGIAKCGYCGDAMLTWDRKERGHTILVCGRYRRTGGAECQTNYHRAEPVYAAVFAAVQSLVQDPEMFLTTASQSSNSAAEQIAALEAQLVQVGNQQQNLLDGLQYGLIPADELLKRQLAVNEQRGQLEQALRNLTEQTASHCSFVETALSLQDIADNLPHMSRARQRAMLKGLIERVTIQKGQPPEITWLV